MQPLLAYLDPASSTLIVSAIVGGFAAIVMLIKKFWYRIKTVLVGGDASEPVPADVSTDEE